MPKSDFNSRLYNYTLANQGSSSDSEQVLKTAAIYSYPPCELGLCGQKIKNAGEILRSFIKGEKILENQIKKALKIIHVVL